VAVKKAAKAPPGVVEKLDKLLAEVDPIKASAMLLGGTAAANGIVPPFTRLLLAGGNEVVGEDVKNAILLLPLGLGPALFGWALTREDSARETPQQTTTRLALFCSGAVEVYLLAELFGNPEFMKLLGGVAQSGFGLLKGVTGVPA